MKVKNCKYIKTDFVVLTKIFIIGLEEFLKLCDNRNISVRQIGNKWISVAEDFVRKKTSLVEYLHTSIYSYIMI